ncbi:MAG: hypothetical protein CMI55_02225 [Parcubacteria group bacterium]|jgi:hypothetical protein|nr:hypothetical protein [Parcubacteria group bacterium]|tara:strand:+ start:6072 stop:7583 length:1512 start_codon:yes stop_codon:yes gene_type:complete
MYRPDSPYKIYESKIWWSDKWDPMEYGRDYDFSKPFFEQMKELIREVPWPSRIVIDVVNSDYCKNSMNVKNSYLITSGKDIENCAYGYRLYDSKDSYDCMSLNKSELCYQDFMLDSCYKALFSSHCENCQEIYFCHNCKDCQNCFGCTNLRYKKYHIFNKPYSKEEYLKKLEEFDLGSYKNIRLLENKAKEHHLKYPRKFMFGRHNINVIGEYINNSKNVLDCYSIKSGEDLRYCQFLDTKEESKDIYDQTGFGVNAQKSYECFGVGQGSSNIKFGWHNMGCYNLEYCIQCNDCSDCFACFGLKHKKHCIFNKQYTKEEYKELVPKIKKHMNEMPYVDKKGRVYKYGEFFPAELSPFGYNETMANEYFPLSEKQAIDQGFNWYDKPKAEYKPTIKAVNIPDDIKDIDNKILKEVIKCDNKDCHGTGVFRLIPREFKFYKKQGIPIPRLCPKCRHQERIKQRNPMKLWGRQCMKKGCPNKFQTSYSPDRKEIVYCEQCYNKEVG